jgi:hypothetical protein
MDELREKTQHVVMNDSFTNKTWRCFDMYKNLIYHEQDGDSFDPSGITQKLEVIKRFYLDNQSLAASDLVEVEQELNDRTRALKQQYPGDMLMWDLVNAVSGEVRRLIIWNERAREGAI